MRNTRLLLLAAPLLFGAAFGASAAPRKAKPVKAAPPASVPSVVVGGPFRDVPPDHWAAQAVETLRQMGIVRGYPAAPNQPRTAKEKAR